MIISPRIQLIPSDQLTMAQAARLHQIWDSVNQYYAGRPMELKQLCTERGLYEKYTYPIDAEIEGICIVTQINMEREMSTNP